MLSTEKRIYPIIARYISYLYPDTVFRFDHAAGLYLTKQAALRHKAVNPQRGYPDLFIAKPSKGYAGMFLEIKSDLESPYKKDGKLKKNEHLEEQKKVLDTLSKEGYFATFGVGIEDCLKKIDWYLKK
jgi:hypothetical protein